MERDDYRKRQAEDYNNFISSLRGESKEAARKAEKKQLNNITRSIRKRYKRFKSGELDHVTLFKGDFVSGDFPHYNDSFKIISNESSSNTPVSYFKVFGSFRKIIDKDIVSENFDIGTTHRNKPPTDTVGLEMFSEQNPEDRVKATYLYIVLRYFPDEESIIPTIYFNPRNGNFPLSMIIDAKRLRNVHRK